MPPKKKDKGKAVLKDPVLLTPSKDSPPKEKLLSFAMPIKSWIDMIEDEEARSKALTTHEQVNLWMQSLTKSPELMLALQNISQSQTSSKDVSEKEKFVSKELSKPSSQNVVVSSESSSSQIVLSQPTPSKKTSDWFDKNHF